MTDIKQKVKESYDTIADEYQEEVEKTETPESQKELLKNFTAKINQDGLLLDAGCGHSPFIDHRFRSVGIDISRKQLQEVRSVPIVQGDITNLPFERNTFDGLVAFYSLIHIPLDQHQNTYNEFARVLKNNATAIIVEGSEKWCGKNENWLQSGEEMRWNIAGPDKTEEQLKQAGFTINESVLVPDNLGKDEEEDSDGKLFFLVTINE